MWEESKLGENVPLTLTSGVSVEGREEPFEDVGAARASVVRRSFGGGLGTSCSMHSVRSYK
jgi:hypothetical protein